MKPLTLIALAGACIGLGRGSLLAAQSMGEQALRLSGPLRPCLENAGPRVPRASLGALLPGVEASTAGPLLFRFNPMGGELDQDIYVSAFVDLGPGGQLRDYDCGQLTYNGHRGVDNAIRGFGRQAIGVPVFAAADGVVFATDDGHPDMNQFMDKDDCVGLPNYVSILHAGSRETHYWHLKRGSVRVVPGQVVRAGEQIGEVGSSGCSGGPHLHFEVGGPGGLIEPYAGACDPIGLWENQHTFTSAINVPVQFELTSADPDNFTGNEPLPTRGTFVSSFTTQTIGSRFFLLNVEPNQVLVTRIRRPNGSLAVNSSVVTANNTFLPSTYGTRWNDIFISEVGTWSYEIDLGGAPLVHTTFEVVASASEIQNRPPDDLAGAVIDPATPMAYDQLRCRIQTDVLDDPDFDIVSYRYVWRVNGAIVRDVTSAAWSDQLAAGLAAPGAQVTCDVTPTDGEDSAATVRASVQIPGRATWVPRGRRL